MRHAGFSQESLQFFQFTSDQRRPNESPYMRHSMTSETELQNIAKLYMQDIFEEPERYSGSTIPDRLNTKGRSIRGRLKKKRVPYNWKKRSDFFPTLKLSDIDVRLIK